MKNIPPNDPLTCLTQKTQLQNTVNEEAYPCTATWFHNDCKVTSGVDRVSITHGSITDEDDKTCEFRLSVKAIEISDDGVWSVAVRNGLGTVEDQCRLMLKVPKNYR